MIKINNSSPLQNLSFDLSYGSTEGLKKGRRLYEQVSPSYQCAMGVVALTEKLKN